MNQHLLVKMYLFGVANPGNRFAKAGPVSEASALAAAIVVGLSCDWRFDWAYFPDAAE